MKNCRKSKQFCKHGHDTFIVGRNKYGRCNQCDLNRKRKDPTKDSRIKQFCPKGHDKDIVGRTKGRRCNECQRLAVEEWRNNNPEYSRLYQSTPQRQRYLTEHKQKQRNYMKIYYENNKDKLIEQAKEHYETNKIDIKIKARKHYEENKDEILAKGKQYAAEHREELNEKAKERYHIRMVNDINFRITKDLRGRLGAAIRKRFKAGSAVRNLGCTIEFLKEYIAVKFYGNMTWNNWGKVWELDHIIPLWKFDLTHKEEFKQAVHYTNLQPLTIEEHQKKTNKEMEAFRRLRKHV